jgi:hypothetical protein
MVKIPLLMDKECRIFATFTIRWRKIYGRIDAIVDTGSSKTIISEKDALRLQIPLHILEGSEMAYIGSTPVELFKMGSAILNLRKENDEIESIQFSNICVGRSTKKDEKSKNISLSMPSILGVDFLKEGGFKLIFDPINDIAYLEKKG